MTSRRGFLAGILAAGFAPAAIGSGVLMPTRKLIAPDLSAALMRAMLDNVGLATNPRLIRGEIGAIDDGFAFKTSHPIAELWSPKLAEVFYQAAAWGPIVVERDYGADWAQALRGPA
jgi:hypothetical protein